MARRKSKTATISSNDLTDHDRAIIVATLERAKKQVEATMAEKVKPQPGGYSVDASVVIAGDITVGAGSTTADKQVRTFDDVAVGAYLLGKIDPAERSRVVRSAAKYIARCADSKANVDELNRWRDELTQLADAQAEDLGLVETKPGVERSGSVGGKPSVTVHIDIGDRQVVCEAK